ncbi:dithiol-disulfide isomerase [Lottiidibacillus patelloidae]|uniref:ClpXP adapter protein SpxH n=1 Tax=Lottiidibacillus patelloidae TaxID=2670334 RepID=A0A263BX27_9BACI|nr:ClpXP adapter SpxH family protein [Lottiidibacillus patelloidae]OZM58275.1 dithiol-disulfide isomerase [Lottiidibacillus patelloidae]
MTLQNDQTNCDQTAGYCGPVEYTTKNVTPNPKKRVEIYVFIDPLCPECWGLEPILKKLLIEYGQYLTIRYVLSGNLTSLNKPMKTNVTDLAQIWEKAASRSGMSCDGDIWKEAPLSSLFMASIAIKAAELQGKRHGVMFLRKLRELLFLQKQNVTDEEVLAQCADEAGLDREEFLIDLHSKSAQKALKCDVEITKEMEVEENPTLVFFNERIEDEGVKVTGYYDYNIYVQILQEMVPETLVAAKPPTIQAFMERFQFVATKELSTVYNVSCEEMDKKMKKYMLKQIVELVPMKHGTFWRYIGKSK